jgi:SAM-dependent methyltransferase
MAVDPRPRYLRAMVYQDPLAYLLGVEGVALLRAFAGDGERNGLFDIEEPIVDEMLGRVPPGVAVDAACGTGRYAEYLAGQGHQVIGVDSSPDMLNQARARVPQAEFRDGELHRLPVSDAEADIVVCARAERGSHRCRPAQYRRGPRRGRLRTLRRVVR